MGNFTNELRNYQAIPRELIFDNSLSDRARFLFCYMAAKPEDWDFYLSNMAKELGYSIGTIRKYINELIERGWLEKGEQHNDGRFGAVSYTLKATIVKKPTTEKHDTAKKRVGKNMTQTDNIYYNKKENTKKEKENFSLFKEDVKNLASDNTADDSVSTTPPTTEPVVCDALKESWQSWVGYCQRNNLCDDEVLNRQYRRLYEYSNGQKSIADEIIDRAMCGHYKMFVPLSDEDLRELTDDSPNNNDNRKWE